jgi:uncharacterized membrane protein YoaK (UPF0700 family)
MAATSLLRLIHFCILLQATFAFTSTTTTTTRTRTTKSGPTPWKSHRHEVVVSKRRSTLPVLFSSRSAIPYSPNGRPLFVLQNSATTTAETTAATTTAATRSDGKKRLATGMAFLTGWADILLFLKYKTFATMMTGNLMWLATATVEGNLKNVGYYSSVIASYIFGLTAFRRMDFSLRKKCLRICALLVAGLFVGSDLIYALTSYKSRWLPVMMLASGFGVINSIGTEVAGTLTFVVTGHMTRLIHVAVDRCSRSRGGRKRLSDADKEGVKLNSAVIGGFFGGALFASFLNQSFLLPGAFSMLGLLYGVLFYWLDMESLGGAWWLRKGKVMCEVDDDGDICNIPGEDIPQEA